MASNPISTVASPWAVPTIAAAEARGTDERPGSGPGDPRAEHAAMAPVPAARRAVVAAPAPPGPRLARVSSPCPRSPSTPAAFVWLSVHGGAGGSSLARADAASPGERALAHGVALTGCWPDPATGWPAAVVLVCRTNAAGFTAASRFLQEWAAGLVPDLQVLALAAVADAPRRLPHQLRARLFELSGVAPHIASVPWVEAWRAAPHALDPGASGIAAAIAEHVTTALVGPGWDRDRATTAPPGAAPTPPVPAQDVPAQVPAQDAPVVEKGNL